MRRRLTITLAAGALLAAAAPAHATWPGANGRIAFFGTKGDRWELRTSRLDGSHQDRVKRFPPVVMGLESQSGLPQWSPSGRRIVYQHYTVGFGIATASGRRVRTIHTGFLYPSWSPSGRELIGIDGGTTPFSIARMRADGTGVRHIAIAAAAGVAFPRWSPDGRWIAYEEGTSSGPYVRRVRRDGSGARRLGEGHLPNWSPDGRRIAAAVGPDVWSMRPDGSGRRELVHARNRDSTIAGLSWSPDGRRIAFIRQVPADAHDSSTVMTAPARGGRAHRHWFTRRFVSAIDWQPR